MCSFVIAKIDVNLRYSYVKLFYFDLKQELQGNDDTYNVVENQLSPPIVGASLIRIYPKSQHTRTVCLRLELHGCLYEGKNQVFSFINANKLSVNKND